MLCLLLGTGSRTLHLLGKCCTTKINPQFCFYLLNFCVYVCICISVYMCLCAWRPKIGVASLIGFWLFTDDTLSSSEPWGFANSTSLVNWPPVSYLCLRSTESTCDLHTCLVFTRVLGNQDSGLQVCKTFNLLSHLPSPISMCLCVCKYSCICTRVEASGWSQV